MDKKNIIGISIAIVLLLLISLAYYYYTIVSSNVEKMDAKGVSANPILMPVQILPQPLIQKNEIIPENIIKMPPYNINEAGLRELLVRTRARDYDYDGIYTVSILNFMAINSRIENGTLRQPIQAATITYTINPNMPNMPNNKISNISSTPGAIFVDGVFLHIPMFSSNKFTNPESRVEIFIDIITLEEIKELVFVINHGRNMIHPEDTKLPELTVIITDLNTKKPPMTFIHHSAKTNSPVIYVGDRNAPLKVTSKQNPFRYRIQITGAGDFKEYLLNALLVNHRLKR